MKKLRKELALLDASFDPGRPMKMEKIQAQLDELEADAAEYAIDHDLCPSPALSPSMIACAAGHLTKPRRACVRRAGGSMMMIHAWMRSRKVLKETLIRLPQRRPRRMRDLLQWARRKRSDECQHLAFHHVAVPTTIIMTRGFTSLFLSTIVCLLALPNNNVVYALPQLAMRIF